MSNYVYLEKSDCGATLTTWIYCAFWQLYSAEKFGLVGYINWPQIPNRSLTPYQDAAMFAQKPNMYDWYFVQPLHQGPPPPRERAWLWENCPEQGVHPLMSQPLEVVRQFYKKHLRFSPEVEARGKVLAEKYSIDFSKTIGITWRGTDCVTDGRPKLPIQVYYPFIDEILEKAPDARIACTAEEEGVLDPLLARYPQAFKVQEFFASPAGCMHNPERFSPFSGFERGMQPALMVWLFSKCAYYIKNRSSTGFIASWISDGHIVNLACPENGGFGFDVTKAEIKGKIVPLQYP